MRSYFVRHTEKLLVHNEDLKKLWDEDRVAIHYPDEASGRKDEDSCSLDPEDKGRAKTAISRLVELAKTTSGRMLQVRGHRREMLA